MLHRVLRAAATSEADMDGPLVDLKNVRLVDPMKKLRDLGYQGKVVAEVDAIIRRGQ